MNVNTRQQVRRVPTEFAFIQLEEQYGGRVLNVSPNGLCFEASPPFRLKDEIQFWFTFNLLDRIDGTAKLVWIDATSGTGGLRFTQLGQFAQEQIQSWTRELATEAATEGMRATATEESVPARPAPARVPSYEPAENASKEPGIAKAALSNELPDILPPFGDAVALGNTSTPSEQAQESTELIPLSRHLSVKRSQFILGILVGVLVCSVVGVPVLKYASGPRQSVTAGELPGKSALGSASGAGASESVFERRQDSIVPSNSKKSPKAKRLDLSSNSPLESRVAELRQKDPSGQRDTALAPPSTESLAQPKVPNQSETRMGTPAVNREADSQRQRDSDVSVTANLTAVIADPPESLSWVSRKEPAAPMIPVGGEVKPAHLVKSYPPVYPPTAKNLRVSGDVRIYAVIDATGRVANAKVLSGPPLLQQAALDAVRQSKYEPTLLDGKPTNTHLTVVVEFRLP
jgi:TonB family protein